ncbi:MAG: leucine-rich repeat domain-containing protein [Clostridia bacterium]|nr:leucine-rich repeat domain-containing protein [Clostridia bacterium]
MRIVDGVLTKVSVDDLVNGHFDIPENVHTIGDSVFKGLEGLKSVNIPNSVKKIEREAFANCNLIYSITIPSNVQEIDSEAFINCSNLYNLKLSEGLKSLGSSVFYNCSSLANVSIPESVESIGIRAFARCEGLKKVKLPSNLKSISPFTFETCESLATITLPDSLESIGRNAFMECTGLKSIKIPKNIKNIDVCTFYKCPNLSNVSLPANLTTISDGAFGHCPMLKVIKLPETLTLIGKNSFEETGLKGITIPKSVKTIDNYAFQKCLNLKNLQIEEGVSFIGKGAFKQCNAKKVIIPKSVKTMRDSAFTDCPALKIVDIQGPISNIGNYTFMDCYSLESVHLPDTIKSIDLYAFSGCNKLKDINLIEGLTSIGSNAFSKCYRLDNINIPNTVNAIGSYAFEDCRTIKNITIPKGVDTIHTKTFSNCENLENIKLNSGLKSINEDAFFHCVKLKTMILPETVEKIGDNAFRNCYSISTLFIPKSVKTMGCYNGVTLPYFTKRSDGLIFSKTKEEINGKEMDSINLNLSVLSSNWDNVDMLLSEQKNQFVASFYNEFFSRLPKQRADEFLKSHNFTFFKQIAGKYRIQNLNTFKLFYNLGMLDKPIEHNGKKIDYAQKVTGLMLEKLDKHKVRLDTLYSIGSSMSVLGFKKEFTDFFLENFDDFIVEEKNRYGFIARSYAKFEEIQKTNTSNRGSQRQLKPTIKKFKEYLEENRYDGITEETRPIANTVSPFFGAQTIFDRAVGVMEERKMKNSPDNILSIPLKEERVTSIDNPFGTIDKSSSEIQNIQTQTLDNLSKTAENEFTFEWLAKNDPQNLILGKLCSCCAHVDGMGYGIMRASIIDPNVQNLVIRDEKNEIIAKSTLFINRQEGYGVFNTVQISNDLPKKYKKQVYEKYMLGIEKFVEQYNKEHPETPLTQINVGMTLNDLKDYIEENHDVSKNLLQSINYSRYGANGNFYEGDCFIEQYILYKVDNKNTKNKKSIQISTNDTEKQP